MFRARDQGTRFRGFPSKKGTLYRTQQFSSHEATIERSRIIHLRINNLHGFARLEGLFARLRRFGKSQKQ